MRARKKPWTENELKTNKLLIKDPCVHKGRWGLFFNNENKLHIEIGCGKGGFITQTARENPDINYLAIEREKQVIVSGMRLAVSMELHNLYFILSEAADIREFIGDNEAARIYLNFCDPWPNKKKWAKRRLTHGNYLDLYKYILCDNAQAQLRTDNKQLFDFSVESFTDNGWSVEVINDEPEIKTEYEIKFMALGFPIYRLISSL